MSLKKDLSDRLVKEMYQVMSSRYFARLSTVGWRLLNEWQRTRTPVEAQWPGLEARLARMERQAGALQTKLDALEVLLAGKPEAG